MVLTANSIVFPMARIQSLALSPTNNISNHFIVTNPPAQRFSSCAAFRVNMFIHASHITHHISHITHHTYITHHVENFVFHIWFIVTMFAQLNKLRPSKASMCAILHIGGLCTTTEPRSPARNHKQHESAHSLLLIHKIISCFCQ